MARANIVAIIAINLRFIVFVSVPENCGKVSKSLRALFRANHRALLADVFGQAK
jgi:hypothetical protein